MSDKDVIHGYYKENSQNIARELQYGDVLNLANDCLSHRTQSGRDYAILKFLQHYCECVYPFHGTGSTFFTGDPRVFDDLRNMKASWKFRVKDAYIKSDPFATETVSSNNIKKCMLSKNDIYNSFVDYIENKPFRLFSYVKKGEWYPTINSVMGWSNRLRAYLWRNKDWAQTKIVLESFSKQLAELVASNKSHDALKIYTEIKNWGGITKGDFVTSSDVINALNTVHSYVINGQSTSVKINSTWTKVYALAFPESFVIYDTRVAYAIISIAEDIYRPSYSENSNVESNINQFKSTFNEIGIMPTAARGGTRPRGVRYQSWPNAYGSWRAQLQANELCKGICDCLNAKKMDGRDNWTLREVESVLFMEGY